MPRLTNAHNFQNRSPGMYRFLCSLQFQGVAKVEGLKRYRGLDAWRQSLEIPRFGLLVEGGNKLPVDFHSLLSVDTFGDMVRDRPKFLLEECCPGPEEQAVVGPEGAFVHELVIPFLHADPVAPAVFRPRPPGLTRAMRCSPPGGEWLYPKVYMGPATADQVLRETVSPVVREALAVGSANRWFFIRCGDPDWHMRLRFHGVPGRLLGELLHAFTRAL